MGEADSAAAASEIASSAECAHIMAAVSQRKDVKRARFIVLVCFADNML